MRQRALPWHSFLPCHANRQQKHNCFLHSSGPKQSSFCTALCSSTSRHRQFCLSVTISFPISHWKKTSQACAPVVSVSPKWYNLDQPTCLCASIWSNWAHVQTNALRVWFNTVHLNAQEIWEATRLSLQPFAQMSSIKHSFHTSSPYTQERGTPTRHIKPLFSLHNRRITQIFIVVHKNRLILSLVSLAPFLYKGALFWYAVWSCKWSSLRLRSWKGREGSS